MDHQQSRGATYANLPDRAETELRGRALRYLLVVTLASAGRPMTVRELIAACAAEDVEFTGRASKIISDALRWEIRNGRVKRLGRGVYALDTVPRSTMRWIRHRVIQTQYWIAWVLGKFDAPDQVTVGWRWHPVSWVPTWPGWGSPVPLKRLSG